jgi:APA family basic amino acid/polyamine antiporter
MLGGIFPTIGDGAHHAGPAVVLAFLISGVVCACVAFCYAEFSSMVPVAGSAYTYAYATLGEIIAWIIGWDLILEYGVSAAPVASSWSSYMQGLLATVGVHLPDWAVTANLNGWHSQIDLLAALIVIAISVLLSIGIKESSSVNIAFVVVQVATMIVFIVAVAPHLHASNFVPFSPMGWQGIGASTALVFFAYIGFDTVTVASEEATRPERDVPIGILLSLAIGTVLYVVLTFVTVGALSWTKLSAGAAMLDAVHAATHNATLEWIVGIGGVAGNTTVMLTSLLGQARIFYVMARDRMLPPAVARVHSRFRTPMRMTLITGGIVAVLAAIVPLDFLLKLVNIGTLSAFTIVCLGVLLLRIYRPDARRPYRAPLGIFFPALGALSCLVTMIYLGGPTWIRFIVWFAVGVVFYGIYGYWHSRLRTGVAPAD